MMLILGKMKAFGKLITIMYIYMFTIIYDYLLIFNYIFKNI